MMDTMIINQQTRAKFTHEMERIIENTANTAAKLLGLPEATELSVMIVDNEYIRELNFLYRSKDEATDVLSFALNELGADEPDYEDPAEVNMLGDVVISLEMAQSQSVDYGHSMEREIAYLLTHGLLHLLGYDHDTEADKKIMRDIEEKIMTAVKLPR
jgi:probable rRNA maturation factor